RTRSASGRWAVGPERGASRPRSGPTRRTQSISKRISSLHDLDAKISYTTRRRSASESEIVFERLRRGRAHRGRVDFFRGGPDEVDERTGETAGAVAVGVLDAVAGAADGIPDEGGATVDGFASDAGDAQGGGAVLRVGVGE